MEKQKKVESAATSPLSQEGLARISMPMDGPCFDEREDEEELVMSEVHLGCPPDSAGPHISHFTTSIPPDVDICRCMDLFNDEGVLTHQKICVDEDGDLVVARRSSNFSTGGKIEYAITTTIMSSFLSLHVDSWENPFFNCADYSTCSFNITIQHNIKSSIPSVGLQIWKAELVLSDFVLHKMFTSSEFVGITALELGAGTGLAGMLLAHDAKMVFLTDCGDDILNNCARNVLLNSEVLSYQGAIHVRELNWTNSWPPLLCLENSTENKMYSWTPTEVEEALGASLLLAADVIYSDDLTDSLFSILERLMSVGTQKVMYLALEKRYNFSLDDLDVVANGYSHFLSYLREEEEDEDVKLGCSPCFLGKRLDLSLIPQYMREYDRGTDVELWQIKYGGRIPKLGDSCE